MKKLLPIISALFLLASCGGPSSSASSSSSQATTSETSKTPEQSSESSKGESISSVEVIKKATITLGGLGHAKTDLKAGEYELNKPITFAVTADVGYRVVEVKMGGMVLAPVNGSYSFTPTQEKNYLLEGSTNVLANTVIISFDVPEGHTGPIAHDGVGFATSGDTQYQDIYKNGKLVLKNGEGFRLYGRQTTPNVWVRAAAFIFSSGKENLVYDPNKDAEATYSDGVYTTHYDTATEGDNDILFHATGDVVIDYIAITTEEYKETMAKVTLEGLDSDDKVYYLAGGYGPEFYKNRKEYTSDTEFITNYDYYILVEPGARHAKYYDLGQVVDGEGNGLSYYDFEDDPESPNPKMIRVHRYDFPKNQGTSQKIKFSWSGKNALSSIKIDTESALKYVKGFMETNPIATVGFPEGGIGYGATVRMYTSPKKGYRELKVFLNGTEAPVINLDGTPAYDVTIAEAETNSISFSAKEGDHDGAIRILLTGENADKGSIAGAFRDNQFVFAFYSSDDHPTAKATKFTFQGVELTPSEAVEDEESLYTLSVEQTAVLSATPESDRPALFSATIVEDEAYRSAVTFNKGDFDVTIANLQPTVSEEEPTIAFDVEGRSQVTVKIAPKENKELFAVEVNDVRLKEADYVKNEDGSISYTFKAMAKAYVFLVQTVPSKVTLTSEVTAGYRIADFPTEAINCGEPLNLKLIPADDDHFLFGKTVVVNYDGKDQTVQPSEAGDFLFTIIPVKGATLVKVTVTEAPNN